MNITYILDQYGIDRNKLHQDIENQVLRQYQEYGPSIKRRLNIQYRSRKSRLASLWGKRTHSPDLEATMFDYFPPEFAYRAMNKVRMQETALELYMIKHAIKFANSIRFEVIAPGDDELILRDVSCDWGYQDYLINVDEPKLIESKPNMIGLIVSISILTSLGVALGVALAGII